jgi:hypothetical protein
MEPVEEDHPAGRREVGTRPGAFLRPRTGSDRATAAFNISREGFIPCRIICPLFWRRARTLSWPHLTVPSASRGCGLSKQRRSSFPLPSSMFHTPVTNVARGPGGRSSGLRARFARADALRSGALELAWDGGKNVGVGQIIGNVLAVASSTRGRTVILMMSINTNGSLSGKSLRRTDRGSKGTEIWTRT